MSKAMQHGERGSRGGTSVPPPPSRAARRVAAVVLEGLAGARTPAQAAEALGVSVARYHVLEGRALQGLVAGCEPREKGPGRTPEKALEESRRECDKLRRECARYQALARASHRTVGISPPPRTQAKAGTKKRRPRTPTVRALRAARRLMEAGDLEEMSAPEQDSRFGAGKEAVSHGERKTAEGPGAG